MWWDQMRWEMRDDFSWFQSAISAGFWCVSSSGRGCGRGCAVTHRCVMGWVESSSGVESVNCELELLTFEAPEPAPPVETPAEVTVTDWQTDRHLTWPDTDYCRIPKPLKTLPSLRRLLRCHWALGLGHSWVWDEIQIQILHVKHGSGSEFSSVTVSKSN